MQIHVLQSDTPVLLCLPPKFDILTFPKASIHRSKDIDTQYRYIGVLLRSNTAMFVVEQGDMVKKHTLGVVRNSKLRLSVFVLLGFYIYANLLIPQCN